MREKSDGTKKSFYIFMTSVLGALLFLILDRLASFVYLYLVAGGYITPGVSYYQFLFLDYFTLVFVIMLGAWYGVWLGLYWYKVVYEEQSHGGVVSHISEKYFPVRPAKNFNSQMSAVKRRLETDLWELEDLANKPVAQSPAPIRRRVVRKRAPKKLNGIK